MATAVTTEKGLMRAAITEVYGPAAEVLSVSETERPAPGIDEVLVKVHAAGVDPGVWHLTTGQPYFLRSMGYGLRRPKTKVAGLDLAGVVEAVGPNVTDFRPGDTVFGVGRGSLAEFAIAKADKLAPMPENLTFEQAAAVPISGLTALQGLQAGGIASGQEVLIIGAGGGVGSFAVQIAAAMGAKVTGVCSASKAELVRSLGAEQVIDYTKDDFTDGSRRFDLIIDNAGRRRLSRLRRALTDRGSLVLIGGDGGGRWTGGFQRQLWALLLNPFVSHRLRPLISVERREDLLSLKELIETGKVRPVVERTYPLAETSAAIDYVGSGHALGKVVVTI